MKKLIFILNLLMIFNLTACSKANKSSREKIVSQDTLVEKSEIEEVDNSIYNVDGSETTEIFNKKDFILSSFKENGLELAYEDLIIKEEGPKIVAIYKEIIPNNRPNISKLVFLIENNRANILHLQINNKIIV